MRDELDYIHKVFMEFQIENQKERKNELKMIQYRRKSQ